MFYEDNKIVFYFHPFFIRYNIITEVLKFYIIAYLSILIIVTI